MAHMDSIPGTVLDRLGYALFVREDASTLRLASAAPEWLGMLWPAINDPSGLLPVSEASPFLENFLFDAEQCWAEASETRVRSGPWVEGEFQLEAMAMTILGSPVLLVERLGEDFEARKAVLQKARENVIAFQRLSAEIQKKEILLHCIAEDMSGALGNVVTALRLIDREPEPAKIRRLLEIAVLATGEQQNLIQRVLALFADELKGIYGDPVAKTSGVDIMSLTRAVSEQLTPQILERGVHLVLPDSHVQYPPVLADPQNLSRVITNLMEHALMTTPVDGTITVTMEMATEGVRWSVIDTGPLLDAGGAAKLFSRFKPGAVTLPPGSSGSALRLHFCRIAIENWGGEIGHSADVSGGNRYWFRLPQYQAQA